jgi:hypothetical protein
MTEKRLPGRPAVDPTAPRSVQLGTSISAKQWAKLAEQAKTERVSVHTLVRRLLTRPE